MEEEIEKYDEEEHWDEVNAIPVSFPPGTILDRPTTLEIQNFKEFVKLHRTENSSSCSKNFIDRG
jgi:hypothetical protein